jgi:short-subunit dehydrogenase
MGKTVLVTGATRGIGREVVKQLTALGFPVFGTGRDEVLLETLKAEAGCLGAAVCRKPAGPVFAQPRSP